MVICNRGEDQIPIQHRCIFICINVASSFHVSAFALPVFAPCDLETHLFSEVLCFLRVLRHERGLPVIVDCGFVLSSVTGRIGQMSVVANTFVLQFLAQFSPKELISNADLVRHIGVAASFRQDIYYCEAKPRC